MFRWIQPDELEDHIQRKASDRFGVSVSRPKTKKQSGDGKDTGKALQVDPLQLQMASGSFVSTTIEQLCQLAFEKVVAEAEGLAFCTVFFWFSSPTNSSLGSCGKPSRKGPFWILTVASFVSSAMADLGVGAATACTFSSHDRAPWHWAPPWRRVGEADNPGRTHFGSELATLLGSEEKSNFCLIMVPGFGTLQRLSSLVLHRPPVALPFSVWGGS